MTTNNPNPVPDPSVLTTYRRAHHWGAATIGSFGVVAVVLCSGYLVAGAVTSGSGRAASPIANITARGAARSIGRVIDSRLQNERLKILLGVVETAPAPASPAAALQKIGVADGALAPKAVAADFAVTAIQSRGAELTSALANRTNLSAMRHHLDCKTSAGNRMTDDERTSLIEAAALQAVSGDHWKKAVDEWVGKMSADTAVASAWARIPGKPPSIAQFLTGALSVKTLPNAAARQLALDMNLATLPASELDLAGKDLAARLAWGTVAVLFVGLWCATVSICVWQIWTLLYRPALVVVLGLAGAGIAGYIVGISTDALAPGRLELLGALLTEIEVDAGTSIIETSRWLTALAASAVVLLLITSAAITYHDNASLIESQLEGLRAVFNAGAAILVVGTVEIAALYGWAASSVDAVADATSTLNDAALLAGGFSGALFSAALVLVYLPAASILRRRAQTNAVATTLTEQGFDDSGFQQFARLLQALAPLLTAVPITGLIGLMTR